MFIDSQTYRLDDSNYVKSETIKKQIVIGHTSTSDMKHILKWKHRVNGKYNKTAAFTIDKKGQMYNHFDPIYFSNHIGNLDIDKKTIYILLENEGWLVKNEEKNGTEIQYKNWLGDIYNKPDMVLEARWRNERYWAPYTDEQFESTLDLVLGLCLEFNIPKFAMPHNTKLNGWEDFQGVLYKSNLGKHYTDLSPAWKFKAFKEKLENL